MMNQLCPNLNMFISCGQRSYF